MNSGVESEVRMMQELIDKAKEIIENQFDYILKIQGRGREVPSLTILHTLDALDCYRRIKSHSETSSGTSNSQS